MSRDRGMQSEMELMQKQADDQARPIRSVFDADCAEAAECAKAMQWNAQIGTRTCP